MLTARGRPEDVLQGFARRRRLPAKPFELAILIARLESLLRRSTWMKDADAAVDGSTSRKARDAGQPDVERPLDTFSLAGKTLTSRTGVAHAGNTIHLTVMRRSFCATWCRAKAASCRASRS